jgi:hypothetical protein
MPPISALVWTRSLRLSNANNNSRGNQSKNTGGDDVREKTEKIQSETMMPWKITRSSSKLVLLGLSQETSRTGYEYCAFVSARPHRFIHLRKNFAVRMKRDPWPHGQIIKPVRSRLRTIDKVVAPPSSWVSGPPCPQVLHGRGPGTKHFA